MAEFMDDEDATLLSIYELLKTSNAKMQEGFSTDNSRAPTWGPNASISAPAQVAQATTYVAETTEAKRDNYLTQFSKFNAYMEGDKGAFYRPKGKGTSGWTVGQGIDISQIRREEAIGLGMPQMLVDVADKYKAWGVEGKTVPKEVQNMSVDMESEEWQTFGKNVARTKLPLMEKLELDNPSLSTRAIVTLAQADHWSGGLYNRPRSASKFNRSTISLKTGGARTSATDNLQNPMALELESGKATDEGISEVFNLIKDSYGNSRPLNSTTIGRYTNFLETGNFL